MLDNLTGTEGLPSPDLIRDLRALCSLGKEELAGIAEAFTSIPEEPTTESIREPMLAKLRSVKADPETLSSASRVLLEFLWPQWGRRHLTKGHVVSDLRGLNVSPDHLANVSPLLDAMERKLGGLQQEGAEHGALATGTPQIDSAACVIDARAVFKESRYEKDLGDTQPYYNFHHFVPVAILEIISQLNDDKATQAYLLTAKTLDQLCDILLRAKKRLEIVQRQLAAAQGDDEEPND